MCSQICRLAEYKLRYLFEIINQSRAHTQHTKQNTQKQKLWNHFYETIRYTHTGLYQQRDFDNKEISGTHFRQV